MESCLIYRYVNFVERSYMQATEVHSQLTKTNNISIGLGLVPTYQNTFSENFGSFVATSLLTDIPIATILYPVWLASMIYTVQEEVLTSMMQEPILKESRRRKYTRRALHTLVVCCIAGALLYQTSFSAKTVKATLQNIHFYENDKSGPLQGLIDAVSDVKQHAAKDLWFHMLSIPETTDWLIGNYTDEAKNFYATTLNENAAEIWLHRGFLNETDLVDDPSNADVILIPSYLLLHRHIGGAVQNKTVEHMDISAQLGNLLVRRIQPFFNSSQHRIVLMSTTQNPTESRRIGIHSVVGALRENFGGEAVYSLGFERNFFWHPVHASQVIVIPYVVKPTSLYTDHVFDYAKHGVFYRGDYRNNAVQWAGCNRSMVLPLSDYGQQYPNNTEGINVQLVAKGVRLSQDDYNTMVEHSEFCLAVCGDTVTSRSLASYMVAGCIPVRIGSRLRGYCDAPCRIGWGWTFTNGSSHLPYPFMIDWNKFPEVDEQKFTIDPVQELRDMLDTVTVEERHEMRRIMQRVHRGFIYGWGNPVDPHKFGEAFGFIRQSIVDHLTYAPLG
ncbi:hypothetical protein MPSEU_000223900 [Mayamaea pseudoterrestris]|nr:hypothetical protein MPSEU_000223900 [Mayamaea pseudoterrestris]